MPKVGGEGRERGILLLGGGRIATFELRLKKEPRNCGLYFRYTSNFAIRPAFQEKKGIMSPFPLILAQKFSVKRGVEIRIIGDFYLIFANL